MTIAFYKFCIVLYTGKWFNHISQRLPLVYTQCQNSWTLFTPGIKWLSIVSCLRPCPFCKISQKFTF